MKILMLGIETSVLDEGAKNVATNLSTELAKSHDVLVIHQRRILHPRTLLKAIRFSPDLVLSVHGPGVRTVLLLYILKLVCRRSHSIAIGTQPHESRYLPVILRMFKPDLVLAQSERWREKFSHMGLRVELLPNGVDFEKFKPCNDNEAISSIRNRLGLAIDERILLHIGPLNSNRNHELLARIQRETNWQVVVVGSTTERCLPEIIQNLESAGVKVFVEYFQYINQVYSAADIYVFPVEDRTGSIEFPLTVLEAMACDRPVVSSKFRGLPDFLTESQSLVFFDEYTDLVKKLENVYGQRGNRSAISSLGWSDVAGKIVGLVSELGRGAP